MTRWDLRPQNQKRAPHAEREATFEIADVAHAVPEGLAVANFVESVGVGARDIFGGDHRAADDELADFAGRQFLGLGDRGDGIVGDADDLPVDAGKVAADAGARAVGRLR